MSPRFLYSIIAVSLLISLSTCAFAQYEDTPRSRLGIGVSFSSLSDNVLSELKSAWMGANIDLHLKYDKLDRPNTILSLSWFGSESGPTKASYFPLKLTYIKRLGQSESGGWYLGTGLDAYIVNFNTTDWNPILRDTVASSEHGINLGMGVLCGYEFGGGWYAEARYDKIGALERANGSEVDFSGFTISFGSRLALE